MFFFGIHEQIDEGETNTLQDVVSEGEGCVKQDLDIIDMDIRASTNGCCDEMPIDGYHGEVPKG